MAGIMSGPLRGLAFGLSAFLCVGLTGPSAAQTGDTSVLAKDFRTFLEWFPGRYDNDSQVLFDPAIGTPEDFRNGRIHSIFAPADLPAFGDHVFYVEQYSDNDPMKVYRQRIYVFTEDPDENAIKLVIYTPNDADAFLGAYRDTSVLEGLTPDQARTTPGCEVWWRRRENQFVGYMKDDACQIDSQRLGQRIVITDNLVLTERALWINDQARTVDGEYVFGNKGDIPHKLRKVRPFECWTAVMRGASHGDRAEGMRDWQFKRGGWLHDQGGELHLTTDEDPPREFFLKLRDVEWTYGTRRPSLTLYVHEKGDDRALSYAWTGGGSDRIGINLRWLQASCTYTPERMFADQ